MSEIINLNKIRKARAKADLKVKAATNRVLFGRPKSERQMTELERKRAEKELSGHKLDRPE